MLRCPSASAELLVECIVVQWVLGEEFAMHHTALLVLILLL